MKLTNKLVKLILNEKPKEECSWKLAKVDIPRCIKCSGIDYNCKQYQAYKDEKGLADNTYDSWRDNIR